MFNSGAKSDAVKRLKKLVEEYELRSEEVRNKAASLYQLREDSSRKVITSCDKYFSDLSNAPREFERSVGKLKIEFQSFQEKVQELENEAKKITVQSGSAAGSGVVAGVGVAAFAPSAAMGVATTFGTASTGAAISSLSGAAATNAALAWLGGGAVAAGGGGMAAGNALLALAGPIGWAIGGASLLGAGGYAFYKNAKVIEDANSKSVDIKKQIFILKRADKATDNLIKLTKQHSDGIKKQLKMLRTKAPVDYLDFDEKGKKALGALINNINSLAKLLNQQIEINANE